MWPQGSVVQAVTEAMGILAPITCVVCGCADYALCAECAAGIRARCFQRPIAHGLVVWSACSFEGTITTVLHKYKEEGYLVLSQPLARLLALSIAAFLYEQSGNPPRDPSSRHPKMNKLFWVPVPSPASNFARRGYTPLTKIADKLGLRLTNVLKHVRVRRDQQGLSVLDREANMRHTVSVRRGVDVRGINIVLIDDVVTTGASLRECARALHEAGAHVVAAVTIASTPKKIESFWQITS